MDRKETEIHGRPFPIYHVSSNAVFGHIKCHNYELEFLPLKPGTPLEHDRRISISCQAVYTYSEKTREYEM